MRTAFTNNAALLRKRLTSFGSSLLATTEASAKGQGTQNPLDLLECLRIAAALRELQRAVNALVLLMPH